MSITCQITQHDKEMLCRKAPEFSAIVNRFPEVSGFDCTGDLFYALVESIISQQLAVKAAAAIFGRVEHLLGEISPGNLLAADNLELRQCGLSQRKIDYLRGIADAALSGRINFSDLAEKDDSEVIATLTTLKGVGIWTAEMLLLFALGRPDILSYNDLGIRKGIMALYNLDELSQSDFEFYRKRYSPYGSLASLYLWKIKDGGLCVK